MCWSRLKHLPLAHLSHLSSFRFGSPYICLRGANFERTHTHTNTNIDPSKASNATANSLANCVPLRPINVLCAQILNAKNENPFKTILPLHLCLPHKQSLTNERRLAVLFAFWNNIDTVYSFMFSISYSMAKIWNGIFLSFSSLDRLYLPFEVHWPIEVLHPNTHNTNIYAQHLNFSARSYSEFVVFFFSYLSFECWRQTRWDVSNCWVKSKLLKNGKCVYTNQFV